VQQISRERNFVEEKKLARGERRTCYLEAKQISRERKFVEEKRRRQLK
jgi:hypothetical protein